MLASKAHIDALAIKLRSRRPARAARTAPRARPRRPHPRPRSARPPHRPGFRAARAGRCACSRPRRRPGWGGGGNDPRTSTADVPPTAARPPGSAPRAACPALINLIVPAGTLLGWSNGPAQAGAWGLLDADETRAAVSAAVSHPRTRWCITLTAPDGTALAHGCARGQHPRLLSDLEPQPPPARLAALLRRLSPTFTLIAGDACDHAQAEDQYAPSRRLKHLVRARSATCDAPGCQAQAVYADLDHTLPWPDGPTEQCNLAPRCRTHHRAKQAPDWRVEQPAPGLTRWTLPSGRTHVTTATRYDC